MNEDIKVLIATPIGVDKKIDIECARFCSRMEKKGHRWAVMASHSPATGRNGLARVFLISDCSHVFFLDSDVIPPDDCIDKLLSHNKEVISAVCPTFSIGENTNYRADMIRWDVVDDNGVQLRGLPEHTFQAKAVGGAALLVARDVFEKIEYPYFYFHDVAGGFLSEDFVFCAKLRTAGIPIFVDGSVRCQHYKLVNLPMPVPPTKKETEK